MSTTRRKFLQQASGSAIAGLLAGLPDGWVGSVYANGGPEVSQVRFGIIALTDCASIVMAHELGYFKKYGIQSVISKEASWAVIRDKLNLGENQATHMLFGMPFASTMGLAGSPVKPMVIPWLLNRNGQAITLSNQLKPVKTAAELKPRVQQAKAAGKPMTFAMTFPPGTHAMWMRYWLASGGIHPDRDVSLITIPPPQMVANMKVGKMDGFCVGEPWNQRAITDGIGYTAVTTQQIWRDHPEKVCAFAEEFALRNPRTVKAVSRHCTIPAFTSTNWKTARALLRSFLQASYINCPKEVILSRLLGKYDYGDGRSEQDPWYMTFSSRDCNAPRKSFGLWWLSQFRRWGMVKGAPDYQAIVKKVVRTDLYLEAMKEIGVTSKAQDLQKEKFFDGSFDPADPEKYARVLL